MNNLIALELAKTHLRILHQRDDDYIQLLINASQKAVLNFIDYSNFDDVKKQYGEIEDLVYACLLLLGDMYSNRAAQQDTALYINGACERLMFPYRKMGV